MFWLLDLGGLGVGERGLGTGGRCLMGAARGSSIGRGRIAVGFGGVLGVYCCRGGRRVWGRWVSGCAAGGRPGGGSSCLDPFGIFEGGS
jgi:hypothetical protein